MTPTTPASRAAEKNYFAVKPGSVGFVVQGNGAELRFCTPHESDAKREAARLNAAYRLGAVDQKKKYAPTIQAAREAIKETRNYLKWLTIDNRLASATLDATLAKLEGVETNENEK